MAVLRPVAAWYGNPSHFLAADHLDSLGNCSARGAREPWNMGVVGRTSRIPESCMVRADLQSMQASWHRLPLSAKFKLGHYLTATRLEELVACYFFEDS
jgi:hypothetical protein